MGEKKEADKASIRIDTALRDRWKIWTIGAKVKIGEATEAAIREYMANHKKDKGSSS